MGPLWVEQISILPLFINALRNDENRNHLTCDIKIVGPNIDVSFERADMECFDNVVKEKGLAGRVCPGVPQPRWLRPSPQGGVYGDRCKGYLPEPPNAS